uniref:Uncharacterized protein n=1 Tax=Avena sativa TaxID=4498 RepID=A0ACD5Z1T9_AVESA
MELTSASARPRLGPLVLRFLAAVILAVLTVAVVATSSQLLPIISSWYSLEPVRRATAAAGHGRASRCVMFNFGDSNSDTGGLVAGAGFRLHRPYGRHFFGRPSGRFSDGRLYIDFLCERLGLDHLSPYLESSGVSFRHGANFAAAGAATAQTADSGRFSLPTQLRQFRHFRARTAELRPLGLGSGITDEEFGRAVYSFDIGQNDVSLAFTANLTQERILRTVVPAVAARIRNAIKTVYDAGGRKFVLYSTGPFGCLPSTLSRRDVVGELDGAGCLVRHNAVAEALNARLRLLRHDLAAELPDSVVVGVDMYAIKYGLVANHTAHGFSSPLTACCGAGGPPYNYKPGATCGGKKAKACLEADGERYVSWDGVHYTEAANRIVAEKILSSESLQLYKTTPVELTLNYLVFIPNSYTIVVNYKLHLPVYHLSTNKSGLQQLLHIIIIQGVNGIAKLSAAMHRIKSAHVAFHRSA